MKKKAKLLNFFNPLNKLTRESSLKILITEKELDKRRNISIDFSSTPFKPIKKVIKRNIRQNSFNNIIFNQTENINKSSTNNLSCMPSCNLILNKNYSLYNNNNNFSIKKFPHPIFFLLLLCLFYWHIHQILFLNDYSFAFY
jgi:hypothetical protein